RRERAVGELVRCEIEALTAIARDDIELRHHQHSVYWRAQRCNEQPVITARIRQPNRSRSEATEPVRHEPLTTERRVRRIEVRSRQLHGRTPATSSGIRYNALRAHRYSVLPSAPPHAKLCTGFGAVIVPRCLPAELKIHTPPGADRYRF